MQNNSAVLNVGTEKQLFIDSRFIESSRGIKLQMNPPVKTEPVLMSETEVESHRIGCYSSILEFDSQYYMYYLATPAQKTDTQEDIDLQFTCLAVSDDGVNWRRQRVGMVEFRGSKDNNIVLKGVASMFVDPTASGGYPFKGICQNDATPGSPQGIYAWGSKDGIVWERVSSEPVLPFYCDTANVCFYDTRLNKYVSYLRSWLHKDPKLNHSAPPHNISIRAVARYETDDFYKLPWPNAVYDPSQKRWDQKYHHIVNELPSVMIPDEFDPAYTDIYNPSAMQYPWAEDVYLAFPSLYRRYEEFTAGFKFDSHGRDHRGQRDSDGGMSIQISLSRNGVQWERMREDYVGPGFIGEEDGGSLYMCAGMIRKGDDLYQYYGGLPFTHGDYDIEKDKKTGAIIRTVQRLDGFMSADAGAAGGELTTPPIKFEGNRLELNINCGGMGEAWVEILNADGRAIEGFTMEDSVSVDRNDVVQEVWWKNGPDVSKLAGKPVRLRIKMRSSKLYAIQFVKTK